MENKIKQIMAAVFEIDTAAINDDTGPENVDSWDSLKHMYLVAALEEEFEIKLNDEQINELLNYRLICLVVKEFS